MDTQKVAEYALTVFKKTYTGPGDIEKAFRPAIKKMILFLSGANPVGEELDKRITRFSEEVWGQVSYVSLDVIRCRITDDQAWKDFDGGQGLSQKKEDFYFKKLMAELMKALINMHYRELKGQLETGRRKRTLKK